MMAPEFKPTLDKGLHQYLLDCGFKMAAGSGTDLKPYPVENKEFPYHFAVEVTDSAKLRQALQVATHKTQPLTERTGELNNDSAVALVAYYYLNKGFSIEAPLYNTLPLGVLDEVSTESGSRVKGIRGMYVTCHPSRPSAWETQPRGAIVMFTINGLDANYSKWPKTGVILESSHLSA